MKSQVASTLAGALFVAAAGAVPAISLQDRDVDTTYPYNGPEIPIGDWQDQTVNGNGQGYQRLTEPPAVAPSSSNPSNNINVISFSYLPNGMNIHFQTPFGLGEAPVVNWGSSSSLGQTASGTTSTYDRTPPCSLVTVTECSQFFHDVPLTGLQAGTTYYYQIPAANGTTASPVLSFTTALAAGDDGSFTVAVLNDMGYTNALGTYQQLNAMTDQISFVWHGGDLSYADDWYTGIIPCQSGSDDVCYNGTSSTLPNTPPAPFPEQYNTPLPAGESPSQGGPQGGDMSVLYESNWDLWQQWQNNVTMNIPYMVMPGNHEAACAEFDGPGNPLTAYLNNNEPDSTAAKSALTYYSCPPSQRNFTAFQYRFHMAGEQSGGVGNFWYSFNYGLAHFISLDGETDFAYSPEYPFVRDASYGDTAQPTESETYITDSGPFGQIDNNNWKENSAYEQIQWLQNDLNNINRTATPWVIAMSHRPMYSSLSAKYQENIQDAFQSLLLGAGVDVYLAGHIHWYERLYPLTSSGEVDQSSVINNNTYQTNPGTSMTHIINGAAGNIESHSTLDSGLKDITSFFDNEHYGFSTLNIFNSTTLTWQWIRGDGSGVGDEVTIIKGSSTSGSSGGYSGTS